MFVQSWTQVTAPIARDKGKKRKKSKFIAINFKKNYAKERLYVGKLQSGILNYFSKK